MNLDVVQTLQAKALQVAAALPPEEWARLAALPPEEVAAALSPALRARVQEVAKGLTPDEQAQMRLLVQRVGAGATAGEGCDTTGYAVGLYEGDYGNKARLHDQTPAIASGSRRRHTVRHGVRPHAGAAGRTAALLEG